MAGFIVVKVTGDWWLVSDLQLCGEREMKFSWLLAP